MPASRSLTRTLAGHGGRQETISGDLVSEGAWTVLQEHLEDTVGNFPAPNPLWIEKTWHTPSTLTGVWPYFAQYRWIDYPMFDSVYTFGAEGNHTDPEPSVASAVTSVQAATNPSRPDVSIPNFLYELKDIPEMLHLKGQAHAKRRPSNSAVEGNFGWELLWRDLTRLVDFTASVNKRVTELKRLHAKGGLKRRRTVYDSTATADGSDYFWTLEVSVTAPIHVTSHKRKWVSVLWKPDSPNIPSADELVRQARLAVHGWDFSSAGLAAIIWEAVPWSWLGDYFGNLGSYLDANRNSVGAVATNSCFMEESTLEWAYGPWNISNPFFTCKTGKRKTVTKSRTISSASLTATLPMLSHKQLSTLSSIAFNLNR